MSWDSQLHSRERAVVFKVPELFLSVTAGGSLPLFILKVTRKQTQLELGRCPQGPHSVIHSLL